ncbi:MAG TPA: ATP-binding protein [Clostridiaceae bacterium]|nr:ATP-binding protein [Clostridiaceae bacterium]
MKKYLPRIIDKELKLALESMGAVLIEGPKWCGKTTTGLHHANSFIKMQDPSNMVNNKLIAETSPSLLLEGEKPRLIDEWQTAPILWDTVRVDVDNTQRKGQYILTGSSSPLAETTMHTGTGRIARIKMYPMSLYESNDSSGAVSLKDLFDEKEIKASTVSRDIKDIAALVCRGGFPQNINLDVEKALYSMRQYVQSIYNNDISDLSDTKTDPIRVQSFLRSYSRNVQTLATYNTIMEDMKANDVGITLPTLNSYMEKMQRLFIIDETPGWSPNIRSKSAIRITNKRGFVDPSIPVAVLNINSEKVLKDFKLFGFLFEAMCMRDLKIYSSVLNGNVFYYRDKEGLECDAVIVLPNGDYGLVEIKLGGEQEEVAAENLLKLESLLEATGSRPTFKMILTGSNYAYQRPDGNYVVPITALKD